MNILKKIIKSKIDYVFGIVMLPYERTRMLMVITGFEVNYDIFLF